MTDTEGDPELSHIDTGRRWGKSTRLHEQMEEFAQEDEVNVQFFGEEKMSESKHVSPEEMAERMGVPVEQLGEVIQAQVKHYQERLEAIQRMFLPPKMNRAQRRAAEKARRRRR